MERGLRSTRRDTRSLERGLCSNGSDSRWLERRAGRWNAGRSNGSQLPLVGTLGDPVEPGESRLERPAFRLEQVSAVWNAGRPGTQARGPPGRVPPRTSEEDPISPI